MKPGDLVQWKIMNSDFTMRSTYLIICRCPEFTSAWAHIRPGLYWIALFYKGGAVVIREDEMNVISESL
jgi:hypothetical protein